MALSNEDLRQLISNLSQEERQQLFSQLKEQFDSTDNPWGVVPKDASELDWTPGSAGEEGWH